MNRFILVSGFALAAGCSWSTFDDLADTAWAHAQEKPDSKVSDYGIALVGATSDTAGRVAVLGDEAPTYSTLDMSADGSTISANEDGLGNHSIDTLSTRPILIGDGAGNVAIVDKGIDGAIVVVHGVATLLADTQIGTQQLADSAVFAGTSIIVAATAPPPPAAASANLFVVTGTNVVSCIAQDSTNAPISFAAIAADSTNLFVWTKTGTVLKLALATVEACTTSTTVIAAASTFTSATLPMTNSAQIDLIGNPATFAVLTVFDSNATQSTVGQVDVLDLTAFTQVGTPLPALGARTAALGTLGGMDVLALGFPVGAGSVELHAVDATTGVIDSDAAETLSIPQADSNLQFGRAVTTTKFNGQGILVVGASNVVYSYYQTSLYGNTRQ